jgi:hypothetical protein
VETADRWRGTLVRPPLSEIVDIRALLHSFPGMEHAGGCHCGNIHVRLRLPKAPEDNPLRACTCSFCRSHSPRMLSDPEGLLEVWADDWSLVQAYRFGTRTCDFLICRQCGVLIAAVSDMRAAEARAVVNVNCLIDRARFTASPRVHDFEGETVESRSARRNANWMPAIIRRGPVSV